MTTRGDPDRLTPARTRVFVWRDITRDEQVEAMVGRRVEGAADVPFRRQPEYADSMADNMNESGERPHEGIVGVQFEPDAALAAEMATLAGRYADRGRDLQVALDFSDASIEAADGIGLQIYESLSREVSAAKLEELRSALASELGAYFGETFIRNHGGQWGWVAATGNRVFGLHTNAGLSAFPLGKARRRLQGAENDSLSALYGFLWHWPETQARRRSFGS
ncbi:MAG: hypothetical protein ABSA21_09855 [Candidatus Limnocylindrales bacterium]|jgi:hypothetical protein